MLKCEGYKMFNGIMTVTPKSTSGPAFPPMEIEGTWLYKPEHDCWYCKGYSYPANICEIKSDRTENIK